MENYKLSLRSGPGLEVLEVLTTQRRTERGRGEGTEGALLDTRRHVGRRVAVLPCW